MIIDAHVHILHSEKIDEGFSCPDEFFQKHTTISKAVMMPNVSSLYSFSKLNETFFSYRSNNKKVAFFYLVDPFINNDTLIDRLVIDGLKIHPSVSQLSINHHYYSGFIEYAETLDIPVLVHCGRNEKSDIIYLIEVAIKYPNVNFIAAHFGGNAYELSCEAFLKIKKYSNIFVDTSNGKHPILVEKAVNYLGEERVIFGSDEPYADYRIQKQCVELANISEQIKEKIFYENIQKLISIFK